MKELGMGSDSIETNLLDVESESKEVNELTVYGVEFNIITTQC